MNEMNESIRYKHSKVLKILKEEKPDSCTMQASDDSLRIDLKFISNRPMEIYFIVRHCEASEIGALFVSSFIKSLIEKTLIIEKCKKFIDAKQSECDEREMNGGSLIRGKVVIANRLS